jgi:hypothetical protein
VLANSIGVKTRPTKLEVTKELIIPFVKRKPAFEQPTLQLPLPSHSEKDPRQDEQTKEITLRGIWTIDI